MPNNTPDNLGTRPTSAGLAILAKAIAGKQLVFTRGAFGDSYSNGSFVDPTVAEQAAFTTLINEKLSLPIADIAADAGNAKVELLVKNAELATTFQVREVGLFAKDPDTQQELLYCYIHYGDGGFIMPAKTTSVAIEFFYQLTTAIGAAENVTAVMDRTSLYVTLNKFLEHVNAATPHPNLTPYTLPTASDTTKGGVKVSGNDGLFMDGEFIKASAQIPADLLQRISTIELTLGNHADSIAALDQRVYDLENPPIQYEDVTLTLNTSAGQESNFTLSGKYLLTNDGFFTLQ